MSRISEELRNRTKVHAAMVVRFYVKLPRERREVEVLGHQLLRSGTSVAANTREASRARSDAEFVSKLEIAIQEADESLLWIELLVEECGVSNELAERLHRETGELLAIFASMVSRTKGNR